MNDTPQTLLIVEDHSTLAAIYKEYLRAEALEITHAKTGTEALNFIQNQLVPDVILLDLGLPDMNGMDILKYINQHGLNSSVIIVTAHGTVSLAIEAMREKVFDFVEKPFEPERLVITVRNAFSHRHLKNLVRNYEKCYKRSHYHQFIGESPAMQVVYQVIDNAAASKVSVFITGESGTGKELCADALHKQSPRRDEPFVAVNCAAIPKELMESEIFGHVKGAFTGATHARLGAAQQADKGTLFLDEIADMDFNLQSKILRFVQTGIVQRVGSSKGEQVDLRFICATNRDPLAEVAQGRLREDLYYRLHVIPIHLPPLRERGTDVLLIAKHFLTKFSQQENKSFVDLSPATEDIFLQYEWPGNVRQLQNVIQNVVVLHQGELITPAMLPAPLNSFATTHRSSARSVAPTSSLLEQDTVKLIDIPDSNSQANQHDDIQPLWLLEKQAIEHAIAICGGNIAKAASLLEVSPSTIYRKMQQWENNKN